MEFDTTASTVGWVNEACVNLEESFQRKLMWLACCHHMHDRVLAAVYCEIFGTTSNPENTLFKQFKESWSTLNPLLLTEILIVTNRQMNCKMYEVINELKQLLTESEGKNTFFMDVYSECAEVVLQILGEVHHNR